MPRSKTILIKIFHYFSRYSSQYAKTFRKTFGYYCTSCHNRPRSQDDTRCNNTIHTDPRVISYCYRCRIIFPLIINIMVCAKDSHIRPELNIVSNINCACSLECNTQVVLLLHYSLHRLFLHLQLYMSDVLDNIPLCYNYLLV